MSVNHLDSGLLHIRRIVRVGLKGRTHQAPEPVPVMLRIGRGVNTHKPTTGLYTALEGQLLLIIKDIAPGVHKHHRCHFLQLFISKHTGVFRRHRGQAPLLHQLCQRLDARWNRIVSPAGTLDRKSTRLNSSHVASSYAVFGLTTKKRAAETTHAEPDTDD